MYSVPEKKEHTDYALDTASKLLEFYNDFFEINYPLKKLGEWAQVLAHCKILLRFFFLLLSSIRTLISSFSFVRLGSDPRLPSRSHGELGTHHFQGDQPVGGQRVLSSGKTSSCLCHSAWARSSGSWVHFYVCKKHQRKCMYYSKILICFWCYSGLETW